MRGIGSKAQSAEGRAQKAESRELTTDDRGKAFIKEEGAVAA